MDIVEQFEAFRSGNEEVFYWVLEDAGDWRKLRRLCARAGYYSRRVGEFRYVVKKDAEVKLDTKYMAQELAKSKAALFGKG